MSKAAEFWHSLGGDAVVCDLCPHACRLQPGQRGGCGSRRNDGGTLVSDAYGHPCALAVDPIEKKPLARFMPGTECLSVACTGCNLHCLGCQNHEISQALPSQVPSAAISPSELVRMCQERGLPSLAYTYTEPFTWWEYCHDTAVLAHEHGLKNLLVTAGYACEEPARQLAQVTDAANIDLKYFSDALYRRMSGATLQPVLRTILIFAQAGVHVELTHLMVPGVCDDMAMLRHMCSWLVAGGLQQVPLHITRFFPRHKLGSLSPTPLATLRQARDVALDEGLQCVLLGNV